MSPSAKAFISQVEDLNELSERQKETELKEDLSKLKYLETYKSTMISSQLYSVGERESTKEIREGIAQIFSDSEDFEIQEFYVESKGIIERRDILLERLDI